MPREIERKFLVKSEDWRRHADGGRRLRQAYLAETGKAVVRVRVEGTERGWITIKSAESGRSRLEFEYEIPLADAEALIDLRNSSLLDKTRFLVPHAGHEWEVDVYAGDNEGLVIAEIELVDEAAEFEVPAWAGAEVTEDGRYYAVSLARQPFRSWSGHRGAG